MDTNDGGTGQTNIADAIQYGINSINGNGFEGDRLVIDVSGDGIQNVDLTGSNGDCLFEAAVCTDIVTAQRDAAALAGITINGLAILNDVPPLGDYFDMFVRTADGFVLTATFDSFENAIIEKIGREIGGDDDMMPPPPNEVPEPAPLALLGLGLIGLGWMRWRRFS